MGSRVHEILLVKFIDLVLGPVNAYKKMIKTIKVPDYYPAFSMIKNGQIKPVTYCDFQRFLKDCLEKCGVNSHGFSTHCFRRGQLVLHSRLGLNQMLYKHWGIGHLIATKPI